MLPLIVIVAQLKPGLLCHHQATSTWTWWPWPCRATLTRSLRCGGRCAAPSGCSWRTPTSASCLLSSPASLESTTAFWYLISVLPLLSTPPWCCSDAAVHWKECILHFQAEKHLTQRTVCSGQRVFGCSPLLWLRQVLAYSSCHIYLSLQASSEPNVMIPRWKYFKSPLLTSWLLDVDVGCKLSSKIVVCAMRRGRKKKPLMSFLLVWEQRCCARSSGFRLHVSQWRPGKLTLPADSNES